MRHIPGSKAVAQERMETFKQNSKAWFVYTKMSLEELSFHTLN